MTDDLAVTCVERTSYSVQAPDAMRGSPPVTWSEWVPPGDAPFWWVGDGWEMSAAVFRSRLQARKSEGTR